MQHLTFAVETVKGVWSTDQEKMTSRSCCSGVQYWQVLTGIVAWGIHCSGRPMSVETLAHLKKKHACHRAELVDFDSKQSDIWTIDPTAFKRPTFQFDFQVIIKQAQAILDTLDGITSVHGRFYELSSNYYKLMSNHADYYRDALRFLGCMELNDIPGKKSFIGICFLSLYLGVLHCLSW